MAKSNVLRESRVNPFKVTMVLQKPADFRKIQGNWYLGKSVAMRVWREGSIGATIKDTRTKSRGRAEVWEGGGTGWGGVEGWGENADNCN